MTAAVKKGRWVDVAPADVQPGDLANHVQGFDGRTVASVDHGMESVMLFLVTDKPAGPFPRGNYTFKRFVEEA